MIHYQLQCECSHSFNSWFRSGDDFDRQLVAGLLSCPQCGSPSVTKALMAPNVSTSRAKKAGKEASAMEKVGSDAASVEVLPQGELGMSEQQSEIRDVVRKMRDHVKNTADYVGDQFAAKARDIHYGNEPTRGIYGEANIREVKELHEEGIDIMPLPVLPEEKN